MCNNKHLRVIIAGSRDINDYEIVEDAIRESQFPIAVVVSGGARGVDALGELYAESMNIPIHVFEPDWDKNGRAAGPIRNRKMAENADALIAIWDGKSRGTKNMIETATKLGLLVFVKTITRNHGLAEVGKWMDEDKGYSEGTMEAYLEFKKKRNDSF